MELSINSKALPVYKMLDKSYFSLCLTLRARGKRKMLKLISLFILSFGIGISDSQYYPMNYSPVGMGPVISGQQAPFQPAYATNPVNFRENIQFTQMANGEQTYTDDQFTQYSNGRTSEVVVQKQYPPANMMSLGGIG